ncbi:MAG: 4Fe-4S dicluster domain-containing protein [Candidatus Marinimicrobia bacterium]|jgi:molybdopterin-containing oxidoreductase family iron-sulfur binding subunit|nr:4Fe-4S dicluster domain-containing protein [Candidatus Neomarinimicrobiota bacterium]
MNKEKKYWMNKDEITVGEPVVGPADLQTTSTEWNRRDFLKTAGFSLAAFMTACSKTPVNKAIPFLIQPEEIIPGKAYWYSSTSHACGSGCGVLVKNRDSRPIKLEGNPDHPASQGGLCPVCQASVIELYDSKRIYNPQIFRQDSTWAALDSFVLKNLNKTRKQGKKIVLLTETITSPSNKFYIKKFLKKYANASHVEYDPISYSAILDAHEVNYGTRFLPQYDFEKADMILSLDADFLGTWLSPTQFTKDYRKNRNLDSKHISKHIQVESRLSVTGAKADERIVKSPAEMLQLVKDIENTLQSNGEHGIATKIAKALKHYKGKSLVISGVNDIGIQILVNRINKSLGNIGKTVLHNNPSFQKGGSDNAVSQLLTDMESGNVGALLIAGVNPVYDLPEGESFGEYMKTIPTKISFSGKQNETAELCNVICPLPHYLESWSDDEFTSGILSMTQPTIQVLGDTRTFRKSIGGWTGYEDGERNLIRNYWKKIYTTRKKGSQSFNRWWDNLVHDGFVMIKPKSVSVGRFKKGQLEKTLAKNGLVLVAYPSLQMLDGRHAENPWLQELPDPISKLTWDNAANLSPKKAKELGVSQSDVIQVKANGKSVELPVYIQEGQSDDVVAVSLGYGRKGTERFKNLGPDWIQKKATLAEGELVGERINHLLERKENILSYSGVSVSISKTGKTADLALTQTYNTLKNPENTAPPSMKVRPFIQETTFEAYKKDPSSGAHRGHQVVTLWRDDHPYEKHHWGMAIDLGACTGCSACVISCQVENNVPVVGKDEVFRRRDMAWMRIDRYYSGEGTDVDVAFQPMLCQHCDNSPCEPVCPVLATVHSSEGLNQQIYNRCVGTRFCANNCPYKVRRFNWFDYAHDDELENMVLNPDVTVRSRGVMEKCSMCIQRIQEAKIEAKAKGIPLADGDIKLACQQSCPADAITFGDLNDPESDISKLVEDPRHYHVLEELNARPTVGYLTMVRNREDENEGGHHG